ncbi:GPI biosynthesis protein Pig-F [Pilobolus umbonatus]|nr:GPI biosynthesis protein Pig-F [Pilobolus umbonatus]
MSLFGTEFIVGFLAIGVNYVSTFILPTTHLLKDPIQTLSVTVPSLLLGHLLLVMTANVLRGTPNRILRNIGYSLLSVVVGTGVLHALTILFGAPLTEKISNTVLFSAYLSIITIMPCFEVLTENVWLKVFIQHCPVSTPEIYAYTQAICSLSGAWVGAIVLPLDWDREWQAWPISCIISTYVGHSVGVVAAFVWSSLKKILGKKKSE